MKDLQSTAGPTTGASCRALRFRPRASTDAIAPGTRDGFRLRRRAGGRTLHAAARSRWPGCSRALGQFMLDRSGRTTTGYEEVVPAAAGARRGRRSGRGSLPKFAEDLFRTTDGRWLISTAEMSLTNMVRETILSRTANCRSAFRRAHPLFPVGSGVRRGATRGGSSASISSRRSRWCRSSPRPTQSDAETRADDDGSPRARWRRWACPIAGCCCARATWGSPQRGPMIWRSGCRGKVATARYRVARPAPTSRRGG